MKPIVTTLALWLALATGLAQAGAREDLNAFTKGLKGLDGGFSQSIYDSKGKLKERTSGRVALSAPRLFRWEYIKPYPQTVIADGKTVWVYDPDLKQATKRVQGVEEQSSPLAILIDPSRLDKEFVVKEEASTAGTAWLSLAPRNTAEAAFKSARLGFKGGQLSQMSFTDALGQRTDISFAGWKRNPRFASQTFRFTPPKGVDVIGG